VDPDGVQRFGEVIYYTGREIPEIGKNFMTEESRRKGIDTYTFMIQYYALKGLFAEVKRLVAEGRAEEVETLLETPASDLRWEHERRVLLAELPTWSDPRVLGGLGPDVEVPDLLAELAADGEELARRVRESKKKDDRGVRIIDDYDQVHTPAEADKFVKQTAQQAQDLRREVESIVAQLGAAGLEEGVVPIPVGGTDNRLIILTPETALPEVIQRLGELRPSDEKPLPLAVIVENAFQANQVEDALEAAKLSLRTPMVHLDQSEKTLGEEIVDLQFWAWTQAWETFVVNRLSELAKLGRFLRIPNVSFRAWVIRLRDLGVEAAA
jgi:hypothetical protein